MPQWTVFVRQNFDRQALVAALLGAAGVAAQFSVQFPLAAYLAGAAGLIAIHERLRSEFSHGASILTTLLIFGGTTLFWSMTHATSFVEAASFGLVAALTFLASRLRLGRVGLWCVVAAIPPVLRYWAAGVPIETGAASADWSSQLFSSSRGFLSLAPVAYVALLGTVVYFRRNAFAAAASIAVFVVWVAINASILQDAPADGPTGHGLTAALAVLAPGLAFLIDRARARPLFAVAPLVLVALLWNYWLMVQYTVGTLPKDAPVSFADMVRQQAEVHTRRPYVYLFAFPANAWFAWREGVPAERYEVLSAEPRRATIDLVMDRQADRFLLEGWDAPGADPAGPVHWIGERRATIVFPLELPVDRSILVSVTARARFEDPAVNADLALEVNGHEIGRLVAPAVAPIETQLTVPAAAVGRIFRAGYNRLTLISHGVHRADPADEREPGPIASRTGSRAWPVAISRIRIAPESLP